MIQNYLPIYNTPDSPFFMTLDGRLGMLLEFDSTEALLSAFEKTLGQFRFFHSQAIDFFGRKFLCISKYVETSRDGLFSPFFPYKKEKLKQSFLESSALLVEFQKLVQGRIISQYPNIPDISEYHLYKLKYSIDWSTELDKLKLLDGYALLHFPSQSSVKVLYLSTHGLKDLLENSVLCVEFVEHYKETALNFWLPFGAVDYFAELFKL